CSNPAESMPCAWRNLRICPHQLRQRSLGPASNCRDRCTTHTPLLPRRIEPPPKTIAHSSSRTSHLRERPYDTIAFEIEKPSLTLPLIFEPKLRLPYSPWYYGGKGVPPMK